ncbi:hypothetical protein KJ840_04985 [Patescibacteria group bacterium]|nr:hypothetical protein [Patescibacteria group bacterium]
MSKKNLIMEKIKSLWRYRLAPLLLKFSLLINCPKLTAIILVILIRKINHQGDYKVLCLARSIFMDDVRAMTIFSKKIHYLAINLSIFEMIFKYFAKETDCQNLTEGSYHSHDYCRQGKQQYYLFLNRMIPVLQKLLGFNGVLSGNFSYVSQQEFAKVCVEKNIPFIVLYKEALVCHEFLNNYLKPCDDYSFVGTKLFPYSNKIAEALLNKGIPGLIKEKVGCIRGVPRLDFYFLNNKNGSDKTKKQVVFFSFFPKVSFRLFYLNQQQLERVEAKSLEFYRSVMKFASKHKDIKVVIKTKRADYFIQYVKDILSENFNENMENLTITNIIDPGELIKNSFAVMGFSSTTLIEALIAGKIIITPYFGDIFPQGAVWDFFKEYPELVNYVRTYEDLENYILNPDRYLNYDKKIKDNFLEKYLSDSKGGASLRAEQAILDIITDSCQNY